MGNVHSIKNKQYFISKAKKVDSLKQYINRRTEKHFFK